MPTSTDTQAPPVLQGSPGGSTEGVPPCRRCNRRSKKKVMKRGTILLLGASETGYSIEHSIMTRYSTEPMFASAFRPEGVAVICLVGSEPGTPAASQPEHLRRGDSKDLGNLGKGS